VPIIKSAIKRVKVTEAKTLRNRNITTGVKTAIKKYENAAPENAEKELANAFSALDKAAAKGIIKVETASRKKARLAKKLAKPAEA
jgi:small subunit ribosomal protein S20